MNLKLLLFGLVLFLFLGTTSVSAYMYGGMNPYPYMYGPYYSGGYYTSYRPYYYSYYNSWQYSGYYPYYPTYGYYYYSDPAWKYTVLDYFARTGPAGLR